MAQRLPYASKFRELNKESGMVSKQQVQVVLDRVRPFLIADGGDIELLSVDGNSAVVRLSGACANCPSAHMTLHVGIETALRDEIPDFEILRTAGATS
jgi:Fe-S cluster biogenesis protein NfuA